MILVNIVCTVKSYCYQDIIIIAICLVTFETNIPQLCSLPPRMLKPSCKDKHTYQSLKQHFWGQRNIFSNKVLLPLGIKEHLMQSLSDWSKALWYFMILWHHFFSSFHRYIYIYTCSHMQVSLKAISMQFSHGLEMTSYSNFYIYTVYQIVLLRILPN